MIIANTHASWSNNARTMHACAMSPEPLNAKQKLDFADLIRFDVIQWHSASARATQVFIRAGGMQDNTTAMLIEDAANPPE